MVYPPDCLDRLLLGIKRHDPDEIPGSADADANRQKRERYFPHPTREQLRQLMDVAYSASLQPEEGRIQNFSLAFISPEGLGRDYLVSQFSRPNDFTPHTIAKLSPATVPFNSFLGIWPQPSTNQLGIWGLIHLHKGPNTTEPIDGRSASLWNDNFFVIRTHMPGVLFVFHQCHLHLVYARGEAWWDLSDGRLLAALRERAGLNPSKADAISQVVSRMVLFGIGGTLLITDPTVPIVENSLQVSYSFATPNGLLADAVNEAIKRNNAKETELPLRAAYDFVAHLTKIDGAVHVTSDLTILGFGGKITIPNNANDYTFLTEDANPTSEIKERPARPLTLTELLGMRHRSAALFCAQQSGQALAIVVSQDGDVTLFGRKPEGSVLRIGPFALGVGLAG